MTRRFNQSQKQPRRKPGATSVMMTVAKGFLAIIVVTVAWWCIHDDGNSSSSNAKSKRTDLIMQRRLNEPRIKVFSGYVDNAVAQKERRAMASASELVEHVVLDAEEQREFLKSTPCLGGNDASRVLAKYNELYPKRPHLAQELWKYCALHHHGGMYLDAESPLLPSVDALLVEHYQQKNIAVLSDSSFPNTLHGSLVLFKEPKSKVAQGMVQVLMNTPVETLDSSPLLLPRSLYDLVSATIGGRTKALKPGTISDWMLFDQRCSIDPLRKTELDGTTSSNHRLTHHCPEQSGYCCHIHDPQMGVVLMTRHPLLPYQILPPLSALPKPYNAKQQDYPYEDLPFISTIQVKTMSRPAGDAPQTPNFFDTLLRNDCLPSSETCTKCLRDKKGANCVTCKKACPCFCKTLCHVSVEEKFVKRELTVTPPLYSRDPSRIVPRIIHQTWFEEVTKEKYPNMSRLIESFKRSGWEYKFYNDEDASAFLEMHFPSELKEAYDALIPGAFKADLFRYCVLLIHGGVYADMDVMLEANLDAAVGPDVGFMIPLDEPGKSIHQRMCLWNGFIAAAPGHPYLAKVIETVVNNIRNRFTSVDVDNMFCPNPELSVLHAFDTLFTAGPCILGATLNMVLGRHGQTQFEAGEIDPWNDKNRVSSEQGTNFVVGVPPRQPDLRIPGRTILLHQDKWDMGAHRFTLLEKNMVVAATDMPDYDDRLKVEDNAEHYSKTHVKTGIYGLEKLYADKKKADEDIRIYVNAQGNLYKK